MDVRQKQLRCFRASVLVFLPTSSQSFAFSFNVATGLEFWFVSFQFTVIILLMDYRDIITIEPGKRSGQPCIRGLRMTVQDVLEYLAGGMTEEEILDDFPDLTHEDIRACFAFAADRERRLAVLPQYEITV